MAEENQVQQVTKEPQQGPAGPAIPAVMKEPQGEAVQAQQVTTKNPKKVEGGKRLAVHSCRKRKEKKREEQAQEQKGRVNQYYGIGAVIAVGVIGGLGYYIYQSKKREVPNNPPQQPCPRRKCRLTSLRWIKSILYYKNGQEEYSKWPISSGSYISASSWLFNAWKENITHCFS